MYSRVSVCKICFKKILDEQLKMEPVDACIYCLVTYLKHKLQDQTFANQILEKNLADLGTAYQDCIEIMNKQNIKINQNNLPG